MVCFGSCHRNFPHFKRSISLSTAFIYAASTFPIHAVAKSPNEISYEKNILAEENYAQFIARFTELKKEIHSSEHRTLEAFQLLNSLLQEANAMYNASFSLRELLDLSKIQIEQSDFELEIKNSLLKVLENLSSVESAVKQEERVLGQENLLSIEALFQPIYLPWSWNWFKLNKKKKMEKPIHLLQVTYPGEIPPDDPTIPDDLIIAGVEFLVGALLMIIPTGVTQTAGGLLISDAVIRGVNGLKERSELNKAAFYLPPP